MSGRPTEVEDETGAKGGDEAVRNAGGSQDGRSVTTAPAPDTGTGASKHNIHAIEPPTQGQSSEANTQENKVADQPIPLRHPSFVDGGLNTTPQESKLAGSSPPLRQTSFLEIQTTTARPNQTSAANLPTRPSTSRLKVSCSFSQLWASRLCAICRCTSACCRALFRSRLLAPFYISKGSRRAMCKVFSYLLLYTFPLIVFFTLLALKADGVYSDVLHPTIVVSPLALLLLCDLFVMGRALFMHLDMIQPEDGISRLHIRGMMGLIFLIILLLLVFVIMYALSEDSTKLDGLTKRLVHVGTSQILANGNRSNTTEYVCHAESTLLSPSVTRDPPKETGAALANIMEGSSLSEASDLISSHTWQIISLFTPIHAAILTFAALLIVAVIQGLKMSNMSDDNGASATVALFGCLGCCVFSLIIVAAVLTEMKLIGMRTAESEAYLVAKAATNGNICFFNNSTEDNYTVRVQNVLNQSQDRGAIFVSSTNGSQVSINSMNDTSSISQGSVLMSVLIGNGGISWSALFIPLWILEFPLILLTIATLLQLGGHPGAESDIQAICPHASFLCWVVMLTSIFMSQILVCSFIGSKEDAEEILMEASNEKPSGIFVQSSLNTGSHNHSMVTQSILEDAVARLNKSSPEPKLHHVWIKVISPMLAGYLFVLVLRCADAFMEFCSWFRTSLSRLDELRANAKVTAGILRKRKVMARPKRLSTAALGSSAVSPPYIKREKDRYQRNSIIEAEIDATLENLGWICGSGSASDGPDNYSNAERSANDIKVVVLGTVDESEQSAGHSTSSEKGLDDATEAKTTTEGLHHSRVGENQSRITEQTSKDLSNEDLIELSSTLFPLKLEEMDCARRQTCRKDFPDQDSSKSDEPDLRGAGIKEGEHRDGIPNSPTYVKFRSEFESKWKSAVTCLQGHAMCVSNGKNRWICDAARSNFGPCLSKDQSENRLRWRCEQGCDYDLCGACYENQMRISFRLQREASPDPETLESSMRKLQKMRRSLRRQIERVKLRAKYDEVLGSIVEHNYASFVVSKPSVAENLLRLRDLLLHNPPDEIATSSDSDSEDESIASANSGPKIATASKVNIRALEVSHKYLLGEIMEMIRTESEGNWQKRIHYKRMRKEIQHAVGEVLRAFYGFANLDTLSEESYSLNHVK